MKVRCDPKLETQKLFCQTKHQTAQFPILSAYLNPNNEICKYIFLNRESKRKNVLDHKKLLVELDKLVNLVTVYGMI